MKFKTIIYLFSALLLISIYGCGAPGTVTGTDGDNGPEGNIFNPIADPAASGENATWTGNPTEEPQDPVDGSNTTSCARYEEACNAGELDKIPTECQISCHLKIQERDDSSNHATLMDIKGYLEKYTIWTGELVNGKRDYCTKYTAIVDVSDGWLYTMRTESKVYIEVIWSDDDENDCMAFDSASEYNIDSDADTMSDEGYAGIRNQTIFHYNYLSSQMSVGTADVDRYRWRRSPVQEMPTSEKQIYDTYNSTILLGR